MIIKIDRKIWSLNRWQRTHWAMRRAEKQAWVLEMMAVKCEKKLKKATQRRTVKITVGLKRLYDRDNLTIKYVLDSLTKTGLIIDDSEKWIELKQTRQVKSKDPYVEIEIKDFAFPGHNGLTVQENRRGL